MMLNYQSNNMLACLVLLLLVALNQAAHAAENLIIGTVFNSSNNHKAINSALKVYQGTVENGNYSGDCEDAVRQTKNLITGKKVQIILSETGDQCLSKIDKVVIKYSNVLHIPINLNFIPPLASIKQTYSKFIKNQKSPLKIYKVQVSFAPLREKPAHPGKNPDGKIITFLKKGVLLEGNDVIEDTSKIKNCKRDAEKNLIYDYIYTVDWMCVRVVSSNNSSNKDKTGWIHKMLIGQLH